jgi:hypothetical protein
MKIQKYNLFGFPIVHSNIKPSLFDKKEILKDIEDNYRLSNERNNHTIHGNLHHSIMDEDNFNFKKINYETIIPVYAKLITKILKTFEFKRNIKFNFNVVNYTCLSNSQYLGSHNHNESDFTAVHYIQFDEKNHTSTRLINPNPNANHTKILCPRLYNLLSNTDVENAWIYKNWTLNVKENDFVFMPGLLEHEILPQKSIKKNRITIVLNINIK